MLCGDVKISNTHRHHEMNFCRCNQSGCDAEEYLTRWCGSAKFINKYDYNFFDEIILNLINQKLPKFKEPNKAYEFIIKMEDKIIESLI